MLTPIPDEEAMKVDSDPTASPPMADCLPQPLRALQPMARHWVSLLSPHQASSSKRTDSFIRKMTPTTTRRGLYRKRRAAEIRNLSVETRGYDKHCLWLFDLLNNSGFFAGQSSHPQSWNLYSVWPIWLETSPIIHRGGNYPGRAEAETSESS